MSRQIIKRFNDETIFAVAPHDPESKTLYNDANGTTATYKIYDPSMDESLAATEAIGQNVFSVTNPGSFIVGYTSELSLDDDTLHTSIITAVDPSTGEITVADVTLVAATLGNRIRVILGAQVSMAEYGTPKIDKRDWGYKALLVNDHVAHKDIRARSGLDVNAEVIVVNSVDGRKATDTLCYTINGDLCE